MLAWRLASTASTSSPFKQGAGSADELGIDEDADALLDLGVLDGWDAVPLVVSFGESPVGFARSRHGQSSAPGGFGFGIVGIRGRAD